MSKVKDQTATQVQLDQCTGLYAIRIRAAAATMSESYYRMNLFRAVAIPICAGVVTCPAVMKVANAYFKAEKLIQTATKLYWVKQQRLWNIPFFNHCTIPFTTKKSDFPDFPFTIIQGDESDLFNATEVTPSNSEENNEELEISLLYKKFSSTAKVKKTKSVPKSTWTVFWSN